jgi:protein-tyrosine phosphatase
VSFRFRLPNGTKKNDATTRTSLTHPIRVDWLPREGEGPAGAVGMTFAPGKRCDSTYGFRWDRDLDLDLEQLTKVERADVLVSLIEDHELGTYGIVDLFVRAAAHGLEVHRLPIRDMDVPPPSERPAVEATLALMKARVAIGKRVVVHCIGGLGRTGTIAGCWLVSTGIAADDALAILKRIRGGPEDRCPERAHQRQFVRDW